MRVLFALFFVVLLVVILVVLPGTGFGVYPVPVLKTATYLFDRLFDRQQNRVAVLAVDDNSKLDAGGAG